MVTDPRHGLSFPSRVDWSRFSRELPQWYDDAIFGIFIHWGPYSVPAWSEPIGAVGEFDVAYLLKHCPYSEWYANTIRISGSLAGEHHHEVWNDRNYDDFLDMWTAENFDANQWLELFEDIGADYVIPTTKHHDGVTLWDAPETGDRNSVHRGPKRDLIGELAEATQRAGLTFGVYYSGGLDWHVRPSAPIDHAITTTEEARPQDFDYGAFAVRHCQDLIDRYHPKVLWNDIGWPDESKFEDTPGSLSALFDYFYDKVPDGVINDRWGVPHSDYVTSEYSQGLDRQGAGKPWEHCRGIGWSFAYNQNETAADMLTGRDIAREIVDKVSRGGRLLLNIGPDQSGKIPEIQQQPLRDLGTWMRGAKPHLLGVRPSAPESTGAKDTWLREMKAADGATLLAVDKVTPERIRVTENVTVDFTGPAATATPEAVAGIGVVENCGGNRWRATIDAESQGPLLLRFR